MRRMLFCLLSMLFTAVPAFALSVDPALNPRGKGVMAYQWTELGDGKKADADLYRKDGTLLRHVDLKREDLHASFPAAIVANFDYSALAFDCVGETKEYYAVMLNRQSGELGYIKKSDVRWRFETWPQHITHLFAVDFDPKTNPLHNKPNTQSDIIPYPATPDWGFFKPKEVKGDWLRVEWHGGEQKVNGWIRWRNGERFLIEMSYAC